MCPKSTKLCFLKKGEVKIANKVTVALKESEYKEIIETMITGGAGFRPNRKIAFALILEANLGIRIGDVLKLTPRSFIKDGERYRLNIQEEKTSKKRPFTVPEEIYKLVQDYCLEYNIMPTEPLVPYKERNIQTYLAKVTDYLGYGDNISTHSFRKFFGTDILRKNGFNFILVQKIFQHSSPAITQRYLGIYSEEMENALKNHVVVPTQW